MAPDGSCFLSLGVALKGHWGPLTAAFNAQPLPSRELALHPKQGLCPSRNRRAGPPMAVLEAGRVESGAPGKGRGTAEAWAADSRPSPSIPSRAWRQWGMGRWGCPRMHTAPSVPAAQCTRGPRGRQPGPTHASTIWAPWPGPGGPAEEAGLCPGAQSGSLLISRGMRDSPRSEWRPPARRRSKQSPHCAQEGSPHGSRP